MKLIMMVFLILLLVGFGCGQDNIPGHIIWHHDYLTTTGQPIAFNDLEFEIFYSGDSLAANYLLLATVPMDSSYSLIADEFLYQDNDLYFYIVARRISTGGRSVPSDKTVGHFFPIIEPGKTYNLQIIEIN